MTAIDIRLTFELANVVEIGRNRSLGELVRRGPFVRITRLTPILLLSFSLIGCVGQIQRSPSERTEVPLSQEQIRQLIAQAVVSSPVFGAWSIIGTAKLTDAKITGPRIMKLSLFGREENVYCVSARMTVAGITQLKETVVYIQRYRQFTRVAPVRYPAPCEATESFVELEQASAAKSETSSR